MPEILNECIDCLLVGARIVTVNELSIKIATLALKLIQLSRSNNVMQLLEVALHLIIVRIVAIVDK